MARKIICDLVPAARAETSTFTRRAELLPFHFGPCWIGRYYDQKNKGQNKLFHACKAGILGLLTLVVYSKVIRNRVQGNQSRS